MFSPAIVLPSYIESYNSYPGGVSYLDGSKKTSTSYDDLLNFMNIMNLHFEPNLKTTKPQLYHTSNVLQTRIIDTNPFKKALVSALNPMERDEYHKIVNHDGFKHSSKFERAEYLHLKTCFFVHAMMPSIFTKQYYNANCAQQYSLENRIKALQKLEVPPCAVIRDLKADLKKLREIRSSISTSFCSEHFLHYRYWFFDLDYSEDIHFNTILDFLGELGLLDYVKAMVQTSPTKYHIYMGSEMICTEDQVKRWQTALSPEELANVLNPEYMKDLLQRHPRFSGNEWFKVAKRGLPAIHRLADVPCPVPVEAKLVDGYYYGDKDVVKTFFNCWNDISNVLGADNRTNDGVRIAQLPGYTNPKSNFRARIIYHNREAPVLTTLHARTVIMDNIKKYYETTGGDNFYRHTIQQENRVRTIKYIFCNIDKTGVETLKNFTHPRFTQGLEFVLSLDAAFKAKQEINKMIVDSDEAKAEVKKIKKKKYFEKLERKSERALKSDKMPSDYMDYCRLNGLLDEIITTTNITGESNRMLLLLCRYVKKYIRLDDPYQQKLYFNTIIKPYFNNRISKDLSKRNWEIEFWNRFVIICRSAMKNLENFMENLGSKKREEINTNNVKVIFEETLTEKLGRTSIVFREVGYTKLRGLIYAAIKKTGKVTELGSDKVEISFFIPRKTMVESIGGRYRDLLRVLEETGSYKVDYKYKRPYLDEFLVWNKGVCKKHTMILKCNKDKILGEGTHLVKKRLSKKEQQSENSRLLLEKLKAKEIKVSRKKVEKGGSDAQTG